MTAKKDSKAEAPRTDEDALEARDQEAAAKSASGDSSAEASDGTPAGGAGIPVGLTRITEVNPGTAN
jgi:hypothetical protein